jgi:hypothetical protein
MHPVSTKKAMHTLSFTLPDDTIIESTHTAMLALLGLLSAANQAHIFPNHFKHPLISV